VTCAGGAQSQSPDDNVAAWVRYPLTAFSPARSANDRASTHDNYREDIMKVLIFFIAWCILLVISWPIAIVALLLAPLVWLVALPFRIVGVVFSAFFAFLRALLFLPARILGHRT
jgi:hypothetical protein